LEWLEKLVLKGFQVDVPSTCRVTTGDYAFDVAAARVWNSLPPEATTLTVRSLPIFKTQTTT